MVRLVRRSTIACVGGHSVPAELATQRGFLTLSALTSALSQAIVCGSSRNRLLESSDGSYQDPFHQGRSEQEYIMVYSTSTSSAQSVSWWSVSWW